MKLEGEAKFLYLAMTQSAIISKRLGKTEKDFVDFAKSIWESMLLTPLDKLEDTILQAMMSDIKIFVDE